MTYWLIMMLFRLFQQISSKSIYIIYKTMDYTHDKRYEEKVYKMTFLLR